MSDRIDDDRIEGSATNLGGKLKEGLGNLTGDSKLQTEGETDQVKGKAQNAMGGMEASARALLDGKDRA